MRAILRVSGREDALAAARLLQARGYDIPDSPDGLGAADLLVVDEWTPEGDPWVREAREAGTPVTVLAELILDGTTGPVVAVTGTAGKTSTCRALEHLLTACDMPVCISGTARSGNAWPDHSLARDLPPGAVTIAELTSTHLCHMGRVRVDVGVVTMVRPDHVELHGSLERYYAAKRRVVEAIPPGAPLILPVDDPTTIQALGVDAPPGWGFGAGHGVGFGAFAPGDGTVLLRSATGVAVAPSVPQGTAGRAAMAAAAAALALGAPADRLAHAMGQVPDAVHRMVRHALPNGVTLIDNTMAATPLKGRAGLGELPPGPLVLVIGGDPSPAGARVHTDAVEQGVLAEALLDARRRADTLVAFGPAAEAISDIVQPDQRTTDVAGALDAAVAACPPGGTVMVAPMFPMTPAERTYVAGYGPPLR
jgi:UDP-N-acetylmuramoylalanine-D-glutamate ligase